MPWGTHSESSPCCSRYPLTTFPASRLALLAQVLVGHSIDSDLRALQIVHSRVIDTAALYPHPRGAPFKLSLKVHFYHGSMGPSMRNARRTALREALAAVDARKKQPPPFGLR